MKTAAREGGGTGRRSKWATTGKMADEFVDFSQPLLLQDREGDVLLALTKRRAGNWRTRRSALNPAGLGRSFTVSFIGGAGSWVKV